MPSGNIISVAARAGIKPSGLELTVTGLWAGLLAIRACQICCHQGRAAEAVRAAIQSESYQGWVAIRAPTICCLQGKDAAIRAGIEQRVQPSGLE